MSAFSRLGILVGIILGSLPAFAAGTVKMLSGMPQPGVYVNSNGSPLIPLLENAKDTLDIEIYTFENQTVRDLIRQALERGVKVRIIKEPTPVGDKCKIFDTMNAEDMKAEGTASSCADQKKLIKEVRSAGGVFEPYNKKALCPKQGRTEALSCVEHGKIALADGIAMVSTGNFDSTNLCIDHPAGCNRDYSLILDDATLVNTIESLFEADLKGKTYDVRTLIPAALSEILTVSPQSEKPLVDFINSAQVSIDLEAQYLKEPAINQAILERAQNGVKVSVTVASPCAFGTPSKGETTQINTIYSEFDKVGISSRMFNASNRINGKRGYMHAKAMVLDGNRAWLGSENGSSASLNENREYGVIFDRAAWVETLLTTMTGDHEDPASESWEDSLTCKNERPNGNRMDMSDFFTSPN